MNGCVNRVYGCVGWFISQEYLAFWFLVYTGRNMMRASLYIFNFSIALSVKYNRKSFSVTSIAAKAFSKSKVKSVSIGLDVKSIGERIFVAGAL